MALFIALLLACLVYGIQYVYFRKHWNQGLRAELHFMNKGVNAGEVSYLEEVITNEKWMPLPALQVKFRTAASFRFAEEKNSITTDYYYRKDLFSVGGRKRVTRSLKFRTGQRGYYQIEEVDILAKNFFFTQQYSMRQSNETALYVYPYKRDTKPFDLLYRQMMGEIIAKHRMEEDPFAFRGIREYRPTDPMRRINWKSSARNGELLVNLFESTTSQTVCILLDGHTHSVYTQKQMQELGISVASSVAERLLQSGIPVALYSNAGDLLTKEPIRTEPGSNRQHMETIDRNLARLDLDAPMSSFVGLIRSTLEQEGNGLCYLLITSDYSEMLQQEYQRQRKNGVEIFGIILLDHEEHWDRMEGLFPWEVD